MFKYAGYTFDFEKKSVYIEKADFTAFWHDSIFDLNVVPPKVLRLALKARSQRSSATRYP